MVLKPLHGYSTGINTTLACIPFQTPPQISVPNSSPKVFPYLLHPYIHPSASQYCTFSKTITLVPQIINKELMEVLLLEQGEDSQWFGIHNFLCCNTTTLHQSSVPTVGNNLFFREMQKNPQPFI